MKTDCSLISEVDKSNLLFNFEPTTETEVVKVIQKFAIKSCVLDPIPTTLFRMCYSAVIQVLVLLINLSISTGVVPTVWKSTVITTLLKKADLNTNDLHIYRPVSNLPFISKICERIVAMRLRAHLAFNKLKYNISICIQTVSLNWNRPSVRHQRLTEMDNREVSILLLLDLSSAFDALDHDILINRLHYYAGAGGIALQWFSSYLVFKRLKFAILFTSVSFTFGSSTRLGFGAYAVLHLHSSTFAIMDSYGICCCEVPTLTLNRRGIDSLSRGVTSIQIRNDKQADCSGRCSSCNFADLPH